MEPDWSYLDFLISASQRLDIVPTAKRVFNADGNDLNIIYFFNFIYLFNILLYRC
jgi:hypothetical protein